MATSDMAVAPRDGGFGEYLRYDVTGMAAILSGGGGANPIMHTEWRISVYYHMIPTLQI